MENEREGMRINRYLANSGTCSRRKADELIAGGHVTIDGKTAVLGDVVPEGACVAINGKPLSGKMKKTYLLLNKPRGIVCTTDPREPMNIASYLNYPERIYPIGRLDKDSDGLILLTSDGDIVNRILRAEYGHEKEYTVWTDKPVEQEFIDKMAAGVYLPELETTTKPCRVWMTGKYQFHIILTQGLNRQIRRMCKELGYHVSKLTRIRVMHIELGDTEVGHWRHLTEEEVAVFFENGKENANA